MNERIKQVWNQAAKTTQGDSWEEQTKFMERFAELIVRECAKICDELQKWPSTEPRHCANDIRIHFGVEE